MSQFKLITATDDDGAACFYVELPDGNETEETESGSIAVFDYQGRTYFATDDGTEYPDMSSGVVYALGAAQDTVVEEEEEEGDDGVDDADGEEDEEDEPEPK